jgi:hypothetical protein
MRIKMICNWTNPKNLCDEWSIMCKNRYKWNDIEITWRDDNIDFFVIINMPYSNEYYDPAKTLVFQMEPWWAVSEWGVWAKPDPTKFLFVGSHQNILNVVQLHIGVPKSFPEVRHDKLVAIVSENSQPDGHKKRLNFIRKLEEKNILLVDVYGRSNYHDFKGYCGKVQQENKAECFRQYKYCLQAENTEEFNYATEKIWEPIVCESLAFYWGCPNLETYLNPLCYVRLELDDIDGSLQIIQKAIVENWWEQRINVIREEKHKILNELGFFPMLDKKCRELRQGENIDI